jgi:hypothetical protein
MKFYRSGNTVVVKGEVFDVSDLLMVCPTYTQVGELVHLYDETRHYVSDGHTQKGLSVPCPELDGLMDRIPELRMCRSQRETDHRYFENLRNQRR